MRRMKGVTDPLVTPVEYVPGMKQAGRPHRETELEDNVAHNLCVIAVRLGELTEAVHLLARVERWDPPALFEAIFGRK